MNNLNNRDFAKNLVTMSAGERALAIGSLPTLADKTMVLTFVRRFEKEALEAAKRQVRGARILARV